MRTEVQIKNLRTLLRTVIGPTSCFMSNEDVDEWADLLQTRVDSIKYMWELKICTQDNVKESWDNIASEPTIPYCTLPNIMRKCNELMVKYPPIIKIRISDRQTHLSTYVIERQNGNEKAIS